MTTITETTTPQHTPDHVTEKRLAEIYGTTQKTLEARRRQGKIPKTVWIKLDNRIYYSIRRYEAWLESQWECRQESKLSETASASVSCETVSAAAKPSPSRRRRRESPPQPVFALK